MFSCYIIVSKVVIYLNYSIELEYILTVAPISDLIFPPVMFVSKLPPVRLHKP